MLLAIPLAHMGTFILKNIVVWDLMRCHVILPLPSPLPPSPLPSFPPSLLQAGREGRKKYGFKKRKLNPSSSTTNREKRKRKTFMMVRKKKSVRAKGMKSFREKQVSTSDCYIVNLIITVTYGTQATGCYTEVTFLRKIAYYMFLMLLPVNQVHGLTSGIKVSHTPICSLVCSILCLQNEIHILQAMNTAEAW